MGKGGVRWRVGLGVECESKGDGEGEGECDALIPSKQLLVAYVLVSPVK